MKERLINVDVFNDVRKRSREDECWHSLAMCIILQALKDYIGRTSGYARESMDWRRMDAELFLRSAYCSFLCVDMQVDGEKLMEYVDRYGMPQVLTEQILGLHRGH